MVAQAKRASVLLLTKNGERYLDELLRAVRGQRGDCEIIETLAVDSGSKDHTVGILRSWGVRIIEISPGQFGHGKTRNAAACHAQGDFLVYLTQDATPAHERWLERLLTPLLADPLVAGAFSRHLPRPTCHPMEWRRIVEEEPSGRPESRVNTAVENPDYQHNPARYYFFTNVSSTIRREVWQRHPFPEVEFAEDQLWARAVLEAGYKTVYAADSLVYHSHGYGALTNLRRHFDHARTMHNIFAVPPATGLREGLSATLRTVRRDLAFWYRHNGRSKSQVVFRWGLPSVSWHLAALFGTWLGERAKLLPGMLSSLLSLQEGIKRG